MLRLKLKLEKTKLLKQEIKSEATLQLPPACPLAIGRPGLVRGFTSGLVGNSGAWRQLYNSQPCLLPCQASEPQASFSLLLVKNHLLRLDWDVRSGWLVVVLVKSCQTKLLALSASLSLDDLYSWPVSVHIRVSLNAVACWHFTTVCWCRSGR